MLTLVATPIGNLEDITLRSLSTLRAADVILCEDTRRSARLLTHYGIAKKLFSYHKFKEKRALEPIIRELETGQHVVLISDAGTPVVNDPGWFLIDKCIEKGIPFTATPGPCSIIQALVLSGMKTEKFQFLGFLSKKPGRELREALEYSGTTIAFESPHRLLKTLQCIEQIDPARKVAVVREMTKVFEECLRGDAHRLLTHFQQRPPRGEIVLVIESVQTRKRFKKLKCSSTLQNQLQNS